LVGEAVSGRLDRRRQESLLGWRGELLEAPLDDPVDVLRTDRYLDSVLVQRDHRVLRDGEDCSPGIGWSEDCVIDL
jgi:hypothetical protein